MQRDCDCFQCDGLGTRTDMQNRRRLCWECEGTGLVTQEKYDEQYRAEKEVMMAAVIEACAT